MTMPAPLGEPTTRERILDEALDLFARQGFAGTSIRQIARAVGLRESSLYNHFPGKAGDLSRPDRHPRPGEFGRTAARSPLPRGFRSDPAGFCRLYAETLLDQWLDPREQRFQDLITAERNRLTAERARFYQAPVRGGERPRGRAISATSPWPA